MSPARTCHGNSPSTYVRRRDGGLEADELLVLIERRRLAAGRRLPRDAVDDLDVVPMALVLAQIAEPLLAIEEQVLIPAVGLVVDLDRAALEADDLRVVAVERAARARAGSSA